MRITLADVAAARTWLLDQRAVVHPGPIETVREALDALEGQLLAHQQRETSRAARTPFSDDLPHVVYADYCPVCQGSCVRRPQYADRGAV